MQTNDHKLLVSSRPLIAILSSLRRKRLVRRRFQRGSLLDEQVRWIGRWREDTILPAGTRLRNNDKIISTGKTVRGLQKDEAVLAPSDIIRRVQRRQLIGFKTELPTKKLAQRRLEELLREINHENYRPEFGEPFKAFAEKWQTMVLIHSKSSNQATCKSHIRVHLLPCFGELCLRDMTAETIQEWISRQTVGPKTVRNVLDTLRSMMKTAKSWGYIRHNPFEDVIRPKKQRPKTYAFTLQETRDIIDEAAKPEYPRYVETLIRIVAESGIRSGEVAGLRIEDFDSEKLTITVNQSVWNKKIQAPKTPNAIRREPISESLAKVISAHIDARKVAKDHRGKLIPNHCGLLFTGQTGNPLQMIHFINRVFRPILTTLGFWGTKEKPGKLDLLGITKCGLHALRRMNATEMDAQNVPIKTMQERLGHSDPSVTLIHYVKPIDQASRQFADRMGAMLAPAKKGETVQ